MRSMCTAAFIMPRFSGVSATIDALVDAAQAQTTRRSGDVLQLPVQALHQRYLDLLVCHDVQPVISSRVLPRLAAMSSGERIFDRAEIVARTTLIGLREP